MAENLLTNAIKYGNGNPIEVEVKTMEQSAIFIVKDHGIGISKEDQKRVFEKFERAASIKTYSGLGLFTSREIVKANGGSITLESEPMKGSIFVVKIPISNNNVID